MPASGLAIHCTSMATGLVRYFRTASSHLPALGNYGSNIEVLSASLDLSRDTLTAEYCILGEDTTAKEPLVTESDSNEAIVRQQRREISSSIDFALPLDEGWDIKISAKPQVLSGDSTAGWRCSAFKDKIGSHGQGSTNRFTLRVQHDALRGPEESIRSSITIQRIAASSEIRLRINDENVPITDAGWASDGRQRSPSLSIAAPLLEDTASLSGISIASTSTQDVATDSRHRITDSVSQFSSSKRTTALASIVRRNYIYFTSMLQEPEAKWKHMSDTKGVSVAQLDSIDPTLVVYRAEATFVGVGVWDIFASISSPGTRGFWDKSLEETRLVDDIGGVSAVWHTKTKAAWPVSPRDSVMVETSYKSPSSVHIFSFSTDDRNLFPNLPSPATGTIRTQVDLRGWSVEALSPTTVHVTLIEQSDPKGWTSKSATPAMMAAAVAGVGEHAIKMGAPPVLTRLLGARMSDAKYDLEKATFRLEYSRAEEDEEDALVSAGTHNVECELRCDVESWCTNLDLVVDPPPINVSCLRRHKLSPGGGGLWLTIEHVPASLEDDSAKVTLRRGAVGKDRGVVTINGAKVKVDIDELKEAEVAQLKEQKRSKPQRVPLDLKHPTKRDADTGHEGASNIAGSLSGSLESNPGSSIPSRVGTPAIDPSGQGVDGSSAAHLPFADKRPKHAMTPALDVLFLLRRIYAERSPDPGVTPAGWSLTSQRNGLFVRRKVMHSISPTIAVQRGDKVVQGVTAEDMVAVVANLSCRKQWDERIESSRLLESYGDGSTVSWITSAGAFPFRGRGFYLSSLTALATPSSSNEDGIFSPSGPSFAGQNVFYHAAASFPDETSTFSASKLNPVGLPVGKVLIDGWIFETLDPYSSTLNYQIPSTRCTHVIAIDYAGSLPATVNTLWNANLPRGILAVEAFLKAKGAIPTIRSPPSCLQVLGDGRDEDHDYAWVIEGERSKRDSTLLFSNFVPSDRRFETLVQVPRRVVDTVAHQSGANVPSKVHGNGVHSTKDGLAEDRLAVSLPRSPSLTEKSVASHSGTSHRLLKATSTNSLRSGYSNPLLTSSASMLRTPRTSLRGPQDIVHPRAFVLADVEVELKHYTTGYKIEVHSQFWPQTPSDPIAEAPSRSQEEETPREESAQPLWPTSKQSSGATIGAEAQVSIHSVAKTKKDLPVEATVFELPPSAVLAATLDPSVRPRRHLLRFSLPSDAVRGWSTAGQVEKKSGSDDDEDNEDDDDADSCITDKIAVDWRRVLRERGAAVRIVIRPIRTEIVASANGSSSDLSQSQRQASEDIDPQAVPVHFGGRRLEVVHVNKTSAMLQREHDLEKGLMRLRRQPRPVDETMRTDVDEVPAALVLPLAVDLDMKHVETEKTKRDSPAGTKNSDTGQPNAEKEVATGGAAPDSNNISAADKGNKISGPSNANQTQKSDTSSVSAATATLNSASAATTHLMGLLHSYPLSRIGASTAVSTVSASGEGSTGQRHKTEDEGATSKGSTGQTGPSASNSTESANDSATTTLGNINVSTVFGGRMLHEPRYSLVTLVAIALICFLAGSLVRAMLSPADFILYPTGTAQSSKHHTLQSGLDAASVTAEEMSRALLQTLGGQGASGGDGAGSVVSWRKVLRLVEIKRAIAGRFDLVLAVVDRR